MVNRFGGQLPVDSTTSSLSFILFGVFGCSAVIGYYQQKEMRILGYRLRNVMRLALYDSLLRRPMSFHGRAQVGELSSRATEDLGNIHVVFSGILSPIFQNMLFIVGCIALMASLNWVATLLVLFLVALPVPALLMISKKIRRLSSETRSEHAGANAFLTESLAAMRDIKAFVREKLELRRYAGVLRRALAAEAEISSLNVKADQAVYLLFSVTLLGIFYFGTQPTFLGSWSLGDVIAFYFYSYTMTMAVLSVGRTYFAFQEFSGTLGRIMELLPDHEHADPLPFRPYAERVTGKIEFKSVEFAYDAPRPVLRNISFTVHPGEWRLITGPSGSGKSTIANLLMGFVEPRTGNISVDDIPLGLWQEGPLRRQIGYVGQDPVLLHGTLRENILFADLQATEEQIQSAVFNACLEDVVESLPARLETLVGERGATLSAGQKARVALARALLHNPPVLLLDEANAAFEPELERRIWRNLARLRTGKTTIIFSHHVRNIPALYTASELRNGMLGKQSRQAVSTQPVPETETQQ
jgi:ABC-type multidrug transport system fused ATPase/permease subunit